jgi:heat shock protein HtpX
MWEQIRANKRKSVVLVVAMGLVLTVLGASIGMAVYPPTEGPIGAGGGVAVALAIWLVLLTTAFTAGDRILLATAHARQIEKADHPRLFNIVEEMSIAGGVATVPRIYIVDDLAPNAFATGRSAEHAAIAVTTGLLTELNRDELQGVVAHEMSHIINRDVAFMTLMGVALGSVVLISETFVRGMFYSGRHSRSSRRGGGGQNPFAILALVLAILSPILAQIIYYAASRRREYLADAHAVVLTRYPEGLASALEAIYRNVTPMVNANKVTAPMFIHYPGQQAGLFGMGSTHPPMSERIKILRSMGGTVSYGSYEQAYRQSTGGKKAMLPQSALADRHAQPAREAHPEAAADDAKRARKRHADDLMRQMNGFMLLPCVCGTRIKLPPEYDKPQVVCPRCKRQLEVPTGQAAAALVAAEVGRRYVHAEAVEAAAQPDAPEMPTRVEYTPGKWGTFTCACGNVLTLTPNFAGTRIRCAACDRRYPVSQK